jgi:alpha-D-xyloside xylohydrolase
MPLYVKAGAILPVGDLIRHTREPQTDLAIYVYAGENGSFTLYEDEGTNYNYEKGACSLIPFHYDETAKTLTVGARKGEFAGMAEVRKFKVIYVSKNMPAGVSQEVVYAGDKTEVKL